MTERKRSAPVPVSDAIASYVTRSGLGARMAQAEVIPDWERLVGPQIAAVLPSVLTHEALPAKAFSQRKL